MQHCAPPCYSAIPGSGFPVFGPMAVPGRAQLQWPDSSTEFDEAPFAYLLRRTLSESNLTRDEQGRAHPPAAHMQRRQRRSLLSTSSAASIGAPARRGRQQLRSLPSSPQGSRSSSPTLAAAAALMRPVRSAAEVLYDAQRALIIGEESKALAHVRECGLPSVLLPSGPLLAVPAIPFRVTCARFVPFVAPEQEVADDVFAPSLPLLSTLKDPPQAWANLIDGILDGRSKNAAVLCCEDRQHLGAAGVSAKETSRRAVVQTLQRRPGTRALVVDWDLHCPSEPPSWEPTPGLLHIGLSRSQGPEVPQGNCISTLNIVWPREANVSDADALAAFRTIIMPVAQALSPDFVLFNVCFSPEITAGAFSRMTRALMGAAQGRLIMHARVQPDRPVSLESVTACMATLLGEDFVFGLATPDLCCELATMTLLEVVAAAASPFWPCLQPALGFRLLSEKQFYTVHGDDTVTATVALASLSMSLREEDEDAFLHRKRALSDSVQGGAAALLKVRNSCSSPSNA